ncbi:GUN4 domain-containing protein [Sphaerospermopsis aphanizomenoides BCCUSP55]|uniref:GUN4 domain-containing protein n=1 Tax=Sphaerospermopsis aphanizomenoides TaxID=459663 RepID=UPI00190393C8|nr:GUN4 domain-containing protein [Sphaerospermopsis aphanizomenoides]MBK1988640.1 GUN4 domain-containing protein [Sphaerospermopsis aphanizomenoides BCCUSP55]
MEPTFLIAGITTSLVNGFVNSRNAEKSREMQASQHQEIAIREQERIKTQERIEILRLLAQKVQQQDGFVFQTELAELNREFQAQENLLNRNLQLKLAELNQEFQSQQGELSRAFSEKIEVFRADLQQYFFEQQRQLQLELKQQDIDLATELRKYDRQTAINVVEEQKRQNSSPIWLVAGDLLKRGNNAGILPLNVFFSPPVLKYDRSKESTDTKGFPPMEKYLQEELRKFFQKYQTSDSFARRGHHQIDYLAGAWTSKQFNSEAAARQIFLGLKSEPTLILESALEGENLSISFAYWGLGHIKERYKTLMSFSWLEVLYGFVKERTEAWFRSRDQEGSSEAEWVKEYGEEFVRKYQDNRAILERERRWLERGEDIRELVRNYNLAPRDWDELKRFVALCHCAIAGWVTDEYFLLDASPECRQQPKLPELLPELLSGMSEAVKQQFIDTSVRTYQELYQGLINDIPDWEPELRLELAACLLKLSSRDTGMAQINAALKAWLSYRGVDWDISTPVIPLLAEVSQPEDESYFDSLYQVWQLVGITDKVDMGGAYYRRGEDFFKRRDYQAACEDFERAIALGYGKAAERREMVLHLQAHIREEALKLQAAEAERQKEADDFYNGGIYHLENGNYERSIADFEQAQSYGHLDASQMIVEAQQKIEERERQKKADDFYNGGIYHLENGNYERSIADFEQAQSYGHSDASRMIVEVRKQQDKAVLAKQQAEAERQRLEQEKRQQEQQAAAQTKLQAQKQQEIKPAASSLVSLKSAVGMDYRKLQDLLAAEKWKEADQETANIMLKIMSREIQGYLDIDGCKNFPKDELKIIDQLWVTYSNGHFGFSVQKEIFTKMGGRGYGYDYDLVCKFGQEVGWKKKGFLGISNGWVIGNDWKLYDDLSFEIVLSSKGHLPYGYRWWKGGGSSESGFCCGYHFLFFRL